MFYFPPTEMLHLDPREREGFNVGTPRSLSQEEPGALSDEELFPVTALGLPEMK